MRLPDDRVVGPIRQTERAVTEGQKLEGLYQPVSRRDGLARVVKTQLLDMISNGQLRPVIAFRRA